MWDQAKLGYKPRYTWNDAVEWKWIDRAPKTKKTKIVSRRLRWLTLAEAERLPAELPTHLADMAQLSHEIGLRSSNVTGLQWSQVDLVRRIAWIHPDQAKAREAITVSLSDTAIAVLRRQRAKKRKPEYVESIFVYHGKPVYRTVTAASALKCIAKWAASMNAQHRYGFPFLVLPSPFFLPLLMCWLSTHRA